MPVESPAVAFRNISKVYDEAGRPHPVLLDVNLDLPTGEFLAILGRSGSGKSTLLNLVAGIDQPTSGEIEVTGVPITRLSERERTLFRRDHIGFIYQFFNLIPTLTVGENVRLPLDLTARGRGGGGWGAGRRGTGDQEADSQVAGNRSAGARVAAMLAAVGLADRADSFPDRLSGGEQQRVAIARALAANPPLVLADEPTGNLDAETGRTVLTLLTGLTRDQGKTLLVATHSRAVAAAADRVLRVEGTHLVAVDPAAFREPAM